MQHLEESSSSTVSHALGRSQVGELGAGGEPRACLPTELLADPGLLVQEGLRSGLQERLRVH